MFTPPNVSRVTCHVSCVTCHVSHVTCHMYFYFFIFFLTKCWSLSLEGLLSTGPTPSTLTLLAKANVPMHGNLLFNFFSLLYFWSYCFNNPFIQSEQFFSSDLFHKGLILVSFKFCFVSVSECNSQISFSIPLRNINGWWFFLFANNLLKKKLNAERIKL